MNIVAICRTFRGEEFALSSLKSIYPHVSRIIYVHQNTSCIGQQGNTVRPVIKDAPDPDKKIVEIEREGGQADQNNAAVEWLEDHKELYDYALIVDTDEVWDENAWEAAKRHLIANLESKMPAMKLRGRLFDYIKSPFFRIDPPGPLRPAFFIHRDAVKVHNIEIRALNISPAMDMDDVWVHHFCSVRKSLHDVWDKHKSSANSDQEVLVDFEKWVNEIWNKLPNAKNVLPLERNKNHWAGVKVVTINDLPEAVRDNPLVKAWAEYPQEKYFRIQRDFSKQDFIRAGLPPDFGPNHPDWKMPSKRNKYYLLLQSKDIGGAGGGGGSINNPTPSIIPEKPLIQNIAKKNKECAKINYTGSLAIMTIVSGSYQWYAPLFIDRIQKEIPEADILIFLRGENKLPGQWGKLLKTDPTLNDYPAGGYTTAALRFVYSNEEIEKYDYVLITDVDMLLMAETPNLINQHMRSCARVGLLCYDNWVSAETAQGPKCPGVHFVTKEWWAATKAAREVCAKELKTLENPSWEHDEIMIGRIIKASNLPLPDKSPRLWANHGIHLGDWRIKISRRLPYYSPDAPLQLYMKKLCEDKDFMEIMHACTTHCAYLDETFEIFRGFFK